MAIAHLKLDHSNNSQDGVLLINNIPVTKIAAGLDVPFYAYDSSLIKQRVMELKHTLPDGIKLHYAMKANPMDEVVSYIADLVDGIDVASGLELKQALKTSTPRSEISFAGPGKSLAELEYAIKESIVLNVESETELDRIITIARASNLEANVAIRVNPDFELKGSGMRMSGGPKPFGIDAERLPDLLPIFHEHENLTFKGLHIFSGSQNLNHESICEAQIKSMELALELCTNASLTPEFLNLGGGFGIPYFPGEERLVLEPIAMNLENLDEILKSKFPNCSIVIELGRYIIGEAGFYVCQVTDIKMSRGHKFIVTNGGLHHHLAASGNFGQVIRKNYPVAIANKMRQPIYETASVVGPLCTPLDLLADKMEFPEAEIGDLVVVFQSGAYGFSASPQGFLSHPPAKEMFI